MVRILSTLFLFAALSACSGTAETSADKHDSRCVSAQKLTKEAFLYADELKDQEPNFDPRRFYAELEADRVDTNGFGIVETEQRSYQIVSDNPGCFGVAKVATARQALKRLDPLLLEAFRLTMAGK